MKPLLKRAVGLVAVLFVAAVLLPNTPTLVRANHGDGNMPAAVSYWVVQDQLRVCDQSTIVTTTRLDGANAIWNSGVGTTILVNSCTNWGVKVIDKPEGACGVPALACAPLPNADSPQQLEVWMEPDSQGSDDFVKAVLAQSLATTWGSHMSPAAPALGLSCIHRSVALR